MGKNTLQVRYINLSYRNRGKVHGSCNYQQRFDNKGCNGMKAIIFLLVVAAASASPTGTAGCVCDKTLKPVCGTDGTTYNNLCLYRCAKKQNKELWIEHTGPCTPTSASLIAMPPCRCTKEYMPVCGTDGVTYPNKCMLNCAKNNGKDGLEIFHAGHCAVPFAAESMPPCVCTREYMPVCGTDGVTYNNKCLLNCARNNGKDGLEVFHEGFCAVPVAAEFQATGCVCDKSLKPVCGTDGTTYNNLCLYRCAKKQNKGLWIAHTGPCAPASVSLIATPFCKCTREYMPVCGTDGVTYNNKCLLNCARNNGKDGLEVFHEGFCAVPVAAEATGCVCDKSLKPVCGTDGATYNNLCLYRCAKKQNKGLWIAHTGPCAPASVSLIATPFCKCTREYMPVCGTDGVTYNNKCLLNCARNNGKDGLEIFHEGHCAVPFAAQAMPPCVCTREYMPVCGTDGVTYDNKCMLNCARNNGKDGLEVFHEGFCAVPVAAEQGVPMCVCNRMYEPLCGSDGRTYNNLCLYNCAQKQNPGLMVRYNGACVSKMMAMPPCVCTREYMPVCGTDGVTYDNKCLLNCARNNGKDDLEIFHEGHCAVPFGAEGVSVCACNRMYLPVCGSNGQTYNNPCLLNCAKKQNPDLTMASMGPCHPSPARMDMGAPCICTKELKPVCGTDGVTYANKCLLNCARDNGKHDLQIHHRGTCIVPLAAEAEVPCVCTMEYNPVCGTDGKTYGNPCEFQCEAKKNSGLKVAHGGECVKNVRPPCPCPWTVFEPVCGTDGETYPSACVLNCVRDSIKPDLKIYHKENCAISFPNKNDVYACPADYRPVCGSDGITYGNKCMFEHAAKTHSGLHIVKEDEC